MTLHTFLFIGWRVLALLEACNKLIFDGEGYKSRFCDILSLFLSQGNRDGEFVTCAGGLRHTHTHTHRAYCISMEFRGFFGIDRSGFETCLF
ncbi:hypothetical protein VTN00DRAFT_6827 [Thermoascus crustaceus]|uniref:uncharacterized protein n=1 Tax=Thermoascus crustaceus TaxID=5088 RepID=UPI0037438AF1